MSKPLYITGTEVRQLQTETPGRTAVYLYQLARFDEVIQVRVLRKRRKTIAIYVEKDETPELRVPLNCPWPEIHHFLADKFEWMIRARNELAARKSAPKNRYEPGGEISYLGKRYRLTIVKSRMAVVEPEGEQIYLSCAHPGRPEVVEKHVLNWYRREAERLFSQRIALLNERFLDNINPGRLSIRKMKARWGSCSTKGDICLNLHLIKAGLPQIDFVIAHELCHLRHFAHNDRFYRLLDDIMPDWREQEVLLGQAA
ncbi:MAG: M48 family metallopeptidase [Pseudomonadales bacterium]|nr:M48 family metallopeptidase [Pseudomonadales bacterium]